MHLNMMFNVDFNMIFNVGINTMLNVGIYMVLNVGSYVSFKVAVIMLRMSQLICYDCRRRRRMRTPKFSDVAFFPDNMEVPTFSEVPFFLIS